MTPRTQRLLAIGGLVFVAVVAVSIFILPNAPDSHANSAKVVSFFQAHKTAVGVSAHLITLGVFVGVCFFWYFRNLVAVTTASRQLANIGFAGALLFASSGAVASAAYYALGDVVGHADPSTVQTLNLLQSDVSDGMSEAGVALFLIATSIAIIRDRRLPQWLAWLGIVLGIASLLVFGIGLPAIGLWLILTCITILVRANAGSAAIATSQEPAVV